MILLITKYILIIDYLTSNIFKHYYCYTLYIHSNNNYSNSSCRFLITIFIVTKQSIITGIVVIMALKCHLKVTDLRTTKRASVFLPQEEQITVEPLQYQEAGAVSLLSVQLMKESSNGSSTPPVNDNTIENSNVLRHATSKITDKEKPGPDCGQVQQLGFAESVPPSSTQLLSSEVSSNSQQEAVVVTIYPPVPSSHLVNGSSGKHQTHNKPNHHHQHVLQQIHDQLTSVYGYRNLQDCSLKFKNIRQSFVPLNMETIKNCASPRNPLLVEICNKYSSTEQMLTDGYRNGRSPVAAMSLQRKQEKVATARNVCNRLGNRLTRLEQNLASRPTRRNSFLEVCWLVYPVVFVSIFLCVYVYRSIVRYIGYW